MSDDLPEEQRRLPIGWLIAGAAVLLFAVLLLFATLGGSPEHTGGGGGTGPTAEENGLEKARQTLARSGSPDSCQTALQQVRSYLTQDNVPEHTPPWQDEEKSWVIDKLGLTREEQEEVGSPSYTTLDAAHLEACLLLRDAARSLARKDLEAGLEQARAAFAWVVRQVRWQPGSSENLLPPTYALSRGWGTALERALIYLALLEQMGRPEAPRPDLLGCLLMIPSEGGKQRLWACGVVVSGGRDVYLFDPRLGLPLPGPKGQGIATLEQARTQEDVLAQLPRGDKDRYDVTRAEARQAKPILVCSLSSLAPRLRYLQETLLPPAVKVRLAADPRHSYKALQAAAGDASFLPEGPRLLRRFLPVAEGGTDLPHQVPLANLDGYTTEDDPTPVLLSRKQMYQLALVPWRLFPRQLRDPQRFPYTVGLGERVRGYFAGPFQHSLQDYNGPRQLMLRGHAGQAVQALMEEKTERQELHKQRDDAGDISPQLNAWVDRAIPAYATLVNPRSSADQREEAKAEITELWKPANSGALALLLGGAIADARLPEIVYLIGLCKHEQAEQMRGRPGEQVQQAWRDALDWWNTFLADYPRHPVAPSVRRLRAEAFVALGERAAAHKDLAELAGSLRGLEKVSALYQAEQVRPKK